MQAYSNLKHKSDEEILEFMSDKIFSNFAHHRDENVGSRDLAKAILDVRSTNIMRKHNEIMIGLTRIITFFTIILAILTGLLVYKEFLR